MSLTIMNVAHAGNSGTPWVLTKNAIVTFTKEDCKTMEGILEDNDIDGLKGMNDDGKLDIIMAGDKFYVIDTGVFDGVDTLRWHGKIVYIPNHVLVKLSGNKKRSPPEHSIYEKTNTTTDGTCNEPDNRCFFRSSPSRVFKGRMRCFV